MVFYYFRPLSKHPSVYTNTWCAGLQNRRTTTCLCLCVLEREGKGESMWNSLYIQVTGGFENESFGIWIAMEERERGGGGGGLLFSLNVLSPCINVQFGNVTFVLFCLL